MHFEQCGLACTILLKNNVLFIHDTMAQLTKPSFLWLAACTILTANLKSCSQSFSSRTTRPPNNISFMADSSNSQKTNCVNQNSFGCQCNSAETGLNYNNNNNNNMLGHKTDKYRGMDGLRHRGGKYSIRSSGIAYLLALSL